MSYQVVQSLVNNEIKEEKDIPIEHKIFCNYNILKENIVCSLEEFRADCILLNTLMQKRRKLRFQKGSLDFEKKKFKFTVGPDGYPTDMKELTV